MISARPKSLDLDGRAGCFELGLDLLGLFLVDAFLDGLRRAFDQRLRLGETELRDRADFLDDVDLLATVAGEDHVELGLRFFRNGASATSGGGSNRKERKGVVKGKRVTVRGDTGGGPY